MVCDTHRFDFWSSNHVWHGTFPSWYKQLKPYFVGVIPNRCAVAFSTAGESAVELFDHGPWICLVVHIHLVSFVLLWCSSSCSPFLLKIALLRAHPSLLYRRLQSCFHDGRLSVHASSACFLPKVVWQACAPRRCSPFSPPSRSPSFKCVLLWRAHSLLMFFAYSPAPRQWVLHRCMRFRTRRRVGCVGRPDLVESSS